METTHEHEQSLIPLPIQEPSLSNKEKSSLPIHQCKHINAEGEKLNFTLFDFKTRLGKYKTWRTWRSTQPSFENTQKITQSEMALFLTKEKKFGLR